MKKKKRDKITPDDLFIQARNESLPPHNPTFRVGEEWTDSQNRAPGTRVNIGNATTENSPGVGDEQAP